MKEDMNKCKHCGYLIEPMKGCGLGKDALDRVKRSQRDIIYISFAQGKRDNLQRVSHLLWVHHFRYPPLGLSDCSSVGR